MPLISYPLQDENREGVRLFVDQFVFLWPLSDGGPGHIALADYNLLDEHLDFCLALLNRLLDGTATQQERETYTELHPREELYATRLFLESLKYIPEGWRDIHAESVDDE